MAENKWVCLGLFHPTERVYDSIYNDRLGAQPCRFCQLRSVGPVLFICRFTIKNQPNVGINVLYMDPMANVILYKLDDSIARLQVDDVVSFVCLCLFFSQTSWTLVI